MTVSILYYNYHELTLNIGSVPSNHPRTRSDPDMPPLGERPNPAHPVVFTLTANLMTVSLNDQCNQYSPSLSVALN